MQAAEELPLPIAPFRLTVMAATTSATPSSKASRRSPSTRITGGVNVGIGENLTVKAEYLVNRELVGGADRRQQRLYLIGGVDMVIRRARAVTVVGAALAFGVVCAAGAAEPPRWLGDELPLPLPVKTPQDISFKAAAEHQYLIFNLMAGGKLAYQRGEYATAADKWEMLLRIARPRSADREGGNAVPDRRPRASGARRRGRARGAAARRRRADGATPAPRSRASRASARRPPARRASPSQASVSGTVSGGGQIGPGGAVVWLRRLDGPMPRIAPPTNQVVTQREKTFLPHVLAIPVGTTVQFRNDDRIYHNVFSIAKPNDFDAGIRATGATYTRTFNSPGAVEFFATFTRP